MQFDAWLHEQGYAPATIRSTLRLVRRSVEAFERKDDLQRYAAVLQRVAAWLKDSPDIPLTPFFNAVLHDFRPLQDAGGIGSRETQALTPDQWRTLLQAVDLALESKQRTKARVVRVLLSLAYPARDLQHRMEQPLPELLHDAPPSVSSLIQSMRRTGAASMVEYMDERTYNSAYKTLYKFLRKLGRDSGIKGLTLSAVEMTSWAIRGSYIDV